jgi:hypothetical protein
MTPAVETAQKGIDNWGPVTEALMRLRGDGAAEQPKKSGARFFAPVAGSRLGGNAAAAPAGAIRLSARQAVLMRFEHLPRQIKRACDHDPHGAARLMAALGECRLKASGWIGRDALAVGDAWMPSR